MVISRLIGSEHAIIPDYLNFAAPVFGHLAVKSLAASPPDSTNVSCKIIIITPHRKLKKTELNVIT